MKCLNIFLVLLYFVHNGNCWTTEDLELFDLVENTPQNFYDVLGVDPKASSSDIRKAYRKLSTLYHPDKNKGSNAEETFRRIAAVADVLRNDERRKTYDLILKTGLPDWRVPIYYYRRVRNMGLFEMTIFLFLLATFAQYLFAWSSYWEKKYEIEEVVLSKIRKKAKNQKRGKKIDIDEDATVEEVMSTLQKPRCQDLFPFRLFYFFIHIIKSSPSYLASCIEYIKQKKLVTEQEEEEDEPQYEAKVRHRKQAKPKIPDYTNISSYDEPEKSVNTNNIQNTGKDKKEKKKWSWECLTEQQVLDFKKAVKKFPVGTLQRWEKVASFLDCEVSEVVAMIKEMKNQQVSKNIPASMQGVTGNEKENFGCELYTEKDANSHEREKTSEKLSNGSCVNNTIVTKDSSLDPEAANSEKLWKQEEQRSLELALQKYPKDTPARWDKIASFVATKSKEECVERFKILAQQIKKKKDKTV